MKLKTYQAYSMAEALAAVKQDLGADAVILNTRTFKRRGLLGIGGRMIVELTASSASEASPAHAGDTDRGATGRSAAGPRLAKLPKTKPMVASGRSAGAHHVAQRAYGRAVKPTTMEGPPTDQDRERTRRLAQAMLEQHRRRESGEATASGPAPEPPSGPATAAPTPEQVPEPVPEPARTPAGDAIHVPVPRIQALAAAPPPRPVPVVAPVARRFVLRDAANPADPVSSDPSSSDPSSSDPSSSDPSSSDPSATVRTVETFGVRAAAVPAPASGTVASGRRGAVSLYAAAPEPIEASRFDGDQEDDASVREELGAIRQMVGEVLQRQVAKSGSPTPSMPERLFDMYLKMIGQDLSEELADEVINQVRDELTPMELEDQDTVHAAVQRRLAEYIPTAEDALPAASNDGRPLTIALIGPTGVGKTTTLAKVAASFKLRHNRRVGLITADTYRIAAVDQLRTYANIIGLPLKVVLTPNEMRQAVLSMSDLDVILIDTAGRSQNDADRIEELKQFVGAAEPHEVHLVLSSTAGEKVLVREAEAFSAVGIDKVVLTKLDEAVSFGVLVNVVRKIGKKLSFFTTGQEVPDQIEVSRAGRLADLVLAAGFSVGSEWTDARE